MPGESRLRLRFITMAWGEAYIKELFEITLAAALAPGNLPAVAPQFDCDMVILTEEGWFDRLRQHPAFLGILKYCRVELRPIDEFITRPDAYGMALTYALFRGFEDLGDEMVNVHLVFLNSDFVLADGSLRTVAAKILKGERLILAPSYCVVAEDVAPRLIARRDQEAWSLVVPPRELAALTIAHRHNTIRGKTINQRVFSMEWIDQFYLLVDRDTMIGRQFPIAVISMRPERVLTDMGTFWDYGIVSEACPTAPRCVIGDSDEFLMTELRGRETARLQIRLGWPSAKQIAAKLYRFITADPVELAGHTLVLHAGELPPTLAEAKAELGRFVEAIRAFLVAPLDHKDHYIWRYHYPTFQKLRADYLASRGSPLPGFDPPAERPPIPSPEEMDSAFEAAAAGVTADMAPQQISSPATARSTPSLFGDRVAGLAPMLKPHLPDIDPIRRAAAHRARDRVLVVSSNHLARRLFAGVGKTELRVDDVLSAPCGQSKTSAQRGSIGPPGRFDICICELSEADLVRSRKLVDAVRPSVRAGGTIFLFHWNRDMGRFELAQQLINADALVFDFPSRIYSGRTLDRADSIRRWDDGLAALRNSSVRMQLRGVRLLAQAMWSALTTNLRGDAVACDRLPDACTSVTIELEVMA